MPAKGFRAELIDDPDALERLGPQWDRLAIAHRRPFCSPAWMLAWWRHVAPDSARLSTVAVFSGDQLCGLAPFYAQRGPLGLVRYRLLSAATSTRIEPLAVPGAKRDVAEAVAATLAQARPLPHCVSLDGVVAGSSWADHLASAWPHRRSPYVKRAASAPVPALTLAGRTYEQWFQSRSSHFRREVRRRRRRLEERGAMFRMATTEADLVAALKSSASLHYSRWSWRGGSKVLNEGVELMLSEAGCRLLPDRRLRLWTIEVDGRAISSQIFLEAGGELTYWLGGFDEEWAKLAPSILGVLAAIEHAFEAGDERVVLGAGAQDYKYSFADEEEAVDWTLIVPRGKRYPLTRAQLNYRFLRRRAMAGLSQSLPQGVKGLVRDVRKRAARFPRRA
jgi:CelD/BcsL family acetyltransferase involved in cellulose biosynthesis